MDKVNDVLKGKYGKSLYKLESDYQKDYDNDIMFRRLANKTKLPTETLMKYTTKFELAACEHKNCEKIYSGNTTTSLFGEKTIGSNSRNKVILYKNFS